MAEKQQQTAPAGPSAHIAGDRLIIDLPINNPPVQSSSGKTMVVASTRGNIPTTAAWEGRPITIGVNAYFKP